MRDTNLFLSFSVGEKKNVNTHVSTVNEHVNVKSFEFNARL